MSLIREILQEGRIGSAQADAARSESKADSAVNAVNRLERRVDRLLLANMALWSMLKEITGLTDDQLSQRVSEIDSADGKEDGRVTPVVQVCPQCTQTISVKHQKCLFCGHIPPAPNVFTPSGR